MTKGEAMQKCELRIEGMDCPECAMSVEERLAKLAGVSQVKVILAAEKAVITYDPRRIGLAQIKEAIVEMGYRVQERLGEAPAEGEGLRRFASAIRLAFVGVVGLLALMEIGAERLGLLDAAVE